MLIYQTRPKKLCIHNENIDYLKNKKRYIDKIYDETEKSELKKEILLELQHRFLNKRGTQV